MIIAAANGLVVAPAIVLMFVTIFGVLRWKDRTIDIPPRIIQRADDIESDDWRDCLPRQFIAPDYLPTLEGENHAD